MNLQHTTRARERISDTSSAQKKGWGGGYTHTYTERGRERERKIDNQDNLQTTMPTPQPPHSLGLHARHAQEVLRIGEVRRQLGELRV